MGGCGGASGKGANNAKGKGQGKGSGKDQGRTLGSTGKGRGGGSSGGGKGAATYAGSPLQKENLSQLTKNNRLYEQLLKMFGQSTLGGNPKGSHAKEESWTCKH